MVLLTGGGVAYNTEQASPPWLYDTRWPMPCPWIEKTSLGHLVSPHT